MASRLLFNSRLLSNRLSRLCLRRGYASQTKNAGDQFAEESFGANIWRNTVLVAIAGVVWYRVDQYITHSGEEKHPITKWIEYHMTPSEENDRATDAQLDRAGKLAEYRLIAQEAQRPLIYRMRYPESFEMASPRGLTAGTHVDLSDLNIRRD
ncbi:uncharacterized protein BYT42DRAFT_567283 [Radiomyces spectabilis]|uniref:uncharacterized protein n=1 Tax=Radiomyces spectabilis TaxID=64574 RepID=UPI00221F591F|nr:uncharacterized protein BYT42DRAFT_567283 [Radiomyces spectabilis]KAI8379063.1 hypothetical protein BYT42DRAFT_567283 [Radiomyces spectabilis]